MKVPFIRGLVILFFSFTCEDTAPIKILIWMHNQWMEDLEDKKIVAVTMVDKSAAFNVCRHKIILSKLKLVGLDSVDWLASYVSGRTQSTALGSTKSTAIHLPPASVVQGGVRSGILYNVMTLCTFV